MRGGGVLSGDQVNYPLAHSLPLPPLLFRVALEPQRTRGPACNSLGRTPPSALSLPPSLYYCCQGIDRPPTGAEAADGSNSFRGQAGD